MALYFPPSVEVFSSTNLPLCRFVNIIRLTSGGDLFMVTLPLCAL